VVARFADGLVRFIPTGTERQFVEQLQPEPACAVLRIARQIEAVSR
jgi:hypothetical protein